MRIVIHHPRVSYYSGGGEVVPLEQAKFLAKMGHRVTVLTRKVRKVSPVFRAFLASKGKGVEVIEVKLPPAYDKILQEPPGQRWLRWDIESVLFGQFCQSFYQSHQRSIDLVITHGTTDSLLIPRQFVNVVHLHGNPSDMTDVIRLSLLRPDGACAVSKSVYEYWKPFWPTGRPLKLIHNGIDHHKFFPDGRVKRDVDVLYVGRLMSHKGVLDIIQAVRSDYRVVLVGDGPLKELIQSTIKRSKKNIALLSNLSEAKLIELYRRSKIFAGPSVAKEGVLTTMLEAAAAGCAIVTTNCCGMTDFAKHGVNAYVVPPHAPKSLAKAFQTILGDPALSAALSSRARSAVLANWTWEKQAKELAQFYLRVVQNTK